MKNNHGRPERVLVTTATLELAAGACVSAIHGLQKFIHSDKALQDDLATMAEHLRTFAKQKPARPRAPKGHAIVPKALLLEGAGCICEGAGEFEDAMGYCTVESDRESLDSKSDRLRDVASKLRRYGK